MKEDRKSKRQKKIKRAIFFILFCFLLLLLWGLIGSHRETKKAESEYEEVKVKVDSLCIQGDFTRALELTHKLVENRWLSPEHSQASQEKAVFITSQIVDVWAAEACSLLNVNQATKAKMITMALPDNLYLEGDIKSQYKEIVVKINGLLDKNVATFLDKALKDISRNQGKISLDVRRELNELKQVVSENYWLNFIAQKANEE